MKPGACTLLALEQSNKQRTPTSTDARPL